MTVSDAHDPDTPASPDAAGAGVRRWRIVYLVSTVVTWLLVGGGGVCFVSGLLLHFSEDPTGPMSPASQQLLAVGMGCAAVGMVANVVAIGAAVRSWMLGAPCPAVVQNIVLLAIVAWMALR